MDVKIRMAVHFFYIHFLVRPNFLLQMRCLVYSLHIFSLGCLYIDLKQNIYISPNFFISTVSQSSHYKFINLILKIL